MRRLGASFVTWLVVLWLGEQRALAAGTRCQPPPPRPGEGPISDLSNLSIDELLEVPTTVATTRETTVFNTPSTVAVIDRETIERHGFRTVAEAVNTLAGFATWKTTSWAELPTSRWILQAHYPDKVLIMIDGVPTWTPVLGESRIGRINIQDIERIEVLRGPSSVLYGTNAYTGAVNIVLRCRQAQDGIGGTAYAGAGNHYAMLGGANVFIDDGDLSLFLGGGGFDEQGDLRRATDAAGVTGYYRDFRRWDDIVLTASYRQHSLLVSLYRSEVTKLGKDPTFAEGWGDPELAHGYLANYTFTHALDQGLELRTGATFDWSQRVFSREQGFDLRTSVIGWRAATFVKANLLLPAGMNLELGIDADYRRSEEYWIYVESTQASVSDSNLRDRHLYEASAFAQLGLQVGDLGLLAGTRFTRNQVFGNNLSSRVSGVYAFNRSNSLKLIFGQSFRAPTLFELHFLDEARTTSGNPELGPETSTSFELAYLTAFHGLFAQALVYHASYEGNIFRTRRPPGSILADGEPADVEVSQYINAPRFRATGVELELTFREGPFSSFASYGYLLGNGGEFNFRYVPQHKAVAGVALAFEGAFASLSGVYLSRMRGPAAVPGPTRIDAQLKLDANLGYAHMVHGKRVRHVISVRNLTNNPTVVPEYVDQVLKSIPYDQTLRVSYTLNVSF